MSEEKETPSHLVKWSAVGISVIFFIVLLEVTGWIYFKLPSTKPIGGYGYPKKLFIAKQDVEYGYTPGFQGYFDGDVYRMIPIHINQQGFRDNEFLPKSPNQKRLVVLGDSVVFGAGVAKEARFTEQLEQIQKKTSAPLEVLNLGVNSYSYWHYVQLMESSIVQDLQPDILLIVFTLNDIQPYAWPTKILKDIKSESTVKHWWKKLRYSFESLYSIQFLQSLERRVRLFFISRTSKEEYSTVWMKRVVNHWQNQKLQKQLGQNLQKSKELAKKWEIPLLVVIAPEINDLKRPNEFSTPRMTIRKYLQEFNIQYCDLFDTFAHLENIDAYYLPGDSVHFSTKGHHFAAEQIESCLVASRL